MSWCVNVCVCVYVHGASKETVLYALSLLRTRIILYTRKYGVKHACVRKVLREVREALRIPTEHSRVLCSPGRFRQTTHLAPGGFRKLGFTFRQYIQKKGERRKIKEGKKDGERR
jgi:hypothetical protein